MYEELRNKCSICKYNLFTEGLNCEDTVKTSAIDFAISIVSYLQFKSEIDDIFLQGLLREGLNNILIGSVKIL